MQEKVSIMGLWCGKKNLSLGITVRHHEASLVMPISDPCDRFYYPHHTPMKDTYFLIPLPVCSKLSFRCQYIKQCAFLLKARDGGHPCPMYSFLVNAYLAAKGTCSSFRILTENMLIILQCPIIEKYLHQRKENSFAWWRRCGCSESW